MVVDKYLIEFGGGNLYLVHKDSPWSVLFKKQYSPYLSDDACVEHLHQRLRRRCTAEALRLRPKLSPAAGAYGEGTQRRSMTKGRSVVGLMLLLF